MDVVVELVEGLLHLRVPADLRSDRDPGAVGCLDEVAVVRRIDEHAWWISQHRAGTERDENRCRAPSWHRARRESLPRPRRGQVVGRSIGGPCDAYLVHATTGTRFPQG